MSEGTLTGLQAALPQPTRLEAAASKYANRVLGTDAGRATARDGFMSGARWAVEEQRQAKAGMDAMAATLNRQNAAWQERVLRANATLRCADSEASRRMVAGMSHAGKLARAKAAETVVLRRRAPTVVLLPPGAPLSTLRCDRCDGSAIPFSWHTHPIIEGAVLLCGPCAEDYGRAGLGVLLHAALRRDSKRAVQEQEQEQAQAQRDEAQIKLDVLRARAERPLREVVDEALQHRGDRRSVPQVVTEALAPIVEAIERLQAAAPPARFEALPVRNTLGQA